jgi:hypothetical protein
MDDLPTQQIGVETKLVFLRHELALYWPTTDPVLSCAPWALCCNILKGHRVIPVSIDKSVTEPHLSYLKLAWNRKQI